MKIFPELLEDNLDFRKVKFFDNSQYLMELETSQVASVDAAPGAGEPKPKPDPILVPKKTAKKAKSGKPKAPKKTKAAAKTTPSPDQPPFDANDIENPKTKPLAPKAAPPTPLIVEADLLKEETFTIEVMRTQRLFQTMYIICCFLSGGLLIVINHWLRNYLFIFATHVEVARFEDGNSVVIRSKKNKIEIAKLRKRRIYVTAQVDFETYTFDFRGCTYFWNDELKTFQEVQVYARSQIVSDYLSYGRKGRHAEEVERVRGSFKGNLIDFKRSVIYKKIKNMLLSPLSVMEIVFILLLIYIEFTFYALVLTAFLATNVWILVKSEIDFEEQVRLSFRQTEGLTLWRQAGDSELQKVIVDYRDVVLGDLVELTNGMHTTFDFLLIQGECFTKDSNTGRESREFKLSRKKPVSGHKIDHKNIIEAGSQILTNLNDVNGQCLGIVLGTGLNTKNGLEIKRILNNTEFKVPNRSELYRLCRYFLVMCLIMVFAFIGLDHILEHPVLAFRYSFSKGVRIILVCFKPTLPLAMFAAFLFSERRLQQNNIQTRNRAKIGKSNQTSQFFIDQNLVLARDFLTKGFLVVKRNEDGKVVFEKTVTRVDRLCKEPINQANNRLFYEAFSLSNDFYRIGNDNIGRLWRGEISDNSPYEYIKTPTGERPKFRLRQVLPDDFEPEYEVAADSIDPYSTTLMVESKKGKRRVFAQLNPELVSERCLAGTIPKNFEKTILKMSLNGLKCVCFGYKDVDDVPAPIPAPAPTEGEAPAPAQAAPLPADWDRGLTFLGVYLLQPDYYENFVAISKHLEEAKIRTTLLCKSNVSEALFLLKSTHTITNKKPIIFVPRQQGPSLKRWLKIEFNNIQSKISLENVTDGEDRTDPKFSQNFWTKNSFVFEGAAACKFLSNETDDNCRALLDNTVGFVNLTETQRIKILQAYTELFPANRLGYLFKKIDNTSVLKLPIVSFAFGNHSLHTPASFLIPKVEIAKAYAVLKEGRSAHYFTSTIFQYLIFFIALQFTGLLIMAFKQTTFTLNQLLFLDFFVLFGVAITVSLIRKVDHRRKKTGTAVLNQRQTIKVAPVYATAAALMMATMLLLWKVPYYDSPMSLAEDDDKHPYPDKYFFYEPFLIFWMVGTYSLVFVLLMNRKIIFQDTYRQKWTFLVYSLFFLGVCLLLLFLHRFKLKRYFVHRLTIALRVPYLFGGFDSILFLKLIVDVMLIYAAMIFGKNLARKAAVAEEPKAAKRANTEVIKMDFQDAVSMDSGSFGSSYMAN